MKAAIWFYALALTIFLVAPVAAQEEGPSILTVDDNPGMDFTTIQSAINAAQPGDIVEVSSGTYTESLVIDKALTLRAAEGANVILDDSSSEGDDGILIGCECLALGNVTIEGITIDYDQVGSRGIDAVVVDVLTLRNLIISANGDAVSAWDAGGIVVENVVVTNSGDDGLDIGALGPISVSGGSVMDVPGWAIWAQGTNVSVDGVAIDAVGTGIEAIGSNVNVTNNLVNDTAEDGIHVEAVNATITGNALTNVTNGIRGAIDGNATVADNTVSNSQYDGIFLWHESETAQGGTITVLNNVIGPVGLQEEYGWGIDLDFDADSAVFDLLVAGNMVDGALDYGIEADALGHVLVTGNNITHVSEGDGISVYGATVTVDDNNVTAVDARGIYAVAGLVENQVVSVSNNFVNDTGDEGIYAEGDHVEILHNLVNDTGDDGIYANAGGIDSVIVSGNEVSHAYGYGIQAYSFGDITIHQNVVNDTWYSGIYANSFSGAVSIEFNEVSESDEDGIEAYGDHVEVLHNVVNATDDDGIYANAGGMLSAIVSENEVWDTGGNGIWAFSSGNVDVAGNAVNDTYADAIYAGSGLGQVFVVGNSVSKSDGGGIAASGPHVSVLYNVVNATDDDGIYASAEGPESIVLVGNQVTHVLDGRGIDAYSSGAATVEDNLVNSTSGDGIYVEAYEATITGNNVSRVDERGIVLVIESGNAASLTSVSDNLVEAFVGHGISVEASDVDAVISNNVIRYDGELETDPGPFGVLISSFSSDILASGNTIDGALLVGLLAAPWASDVHLSMNDVAGPLVGILAASTATSEVDIQSNNVSAMAYGIYTAITGQWNVTDNVVTLPSEPGFELEGDWIAAAAGIAVDTVDEDPIIQGDVAGNLVTGGNGTAGVFWYAHASEESLGDTSFHDNTLATQVGFVIDVLFEQAGGVGEYPITFNDLSDTQVPFGACDLAGQAALAVLSMDLLFLTCDAFFEAEPVEGDLNGTAPLNYYGPAGPPRNAGDFAPIGVEPFLTAAPDPARTTDNVQTFGYFVHIAGPAEGEAPEAVGLGAPTALARPLNEMFDADFAGVVYEFDAASQSWQQSLGDETLGALEARLVLPLNDTRVLIDFADSLFEVPLSREVQAGWNFQAPRQFSNVDRAFDGGTFRTFEVFDLFGQPEQHVDHDGLVYGFPLGELWAGSPYVALNTFDEACSGPLATPFGGYFTSYLGPQVITSVIPAGVGVDDWQQYVPDLVCVDVDLPGDLPMLTFYQDMDGDGFGTDDMTIEAESQPLGYAAQGGDCNDANPSMNPGASEVPNDTFDNDCDPATLDEVPV